MKKTVWTLTLFLTLLTVVGTHFVSLGKSNPYAPIPAFAHPKINILSPEANSLHASNSLTVTFNVSINFEQGWSYISYVTYKASWQQDVITVYEWKTDDSVDDPIFLSEFSYKLNLTEITEGKQTVMINAGGHGGYNDEEYGLLIFDDAYNSTSISFTIRSVSVLSPQSKTYDTSDVPLLFEVPVSSARILYSLDGQDKIMVSGNTTLNAVPTGDHNVTFYVLDEDGNMGASEPIYFSVETPFPTILLASASGVVIAVIGVGLLVYFRKRNR